MIPDRNGTVWSRAGSSVDQAADNRGDTGDGTGATKASSTAKRSGFYLVTAFAVTAGLLSLIVDANRKYAPEMYQPDYMETVADAFESGDNYAVFDLNINIRKLREEQWKRLDSAPSLLVLGASQWQEASADLLPNRSYLNGHIHRDYYEDVLGMVELLVRHDKLPKDLVITIRDRLFTPVAKRTDYLWLPGIPYYQAMAKRLSLPRLTFLETQPLQRPRELLSLSMLLTNTTRWHNASDWPYPTTRKSHDELDVLHPDGSITWSASHLAVFTPERARRVSLAHADASRNSPPLIDPKGVEALDRLLAYLAVKGVRVHLAHPPFNPIFFDRVQGSPYMDGLRQIEAVTRELAAKHKLGIVGSFDPEALGCTAEMFIDAEHSNANCLRALLADVANSVDLPTLPAIADASSPTATAEHRSMQALVASGWMASERHHGAVESRETPEVEAPAIKNAGVPVNLEPRAQADGQADDSTTRTESGRSEVPAAAAESVSSRDAVGATAATAVIPPRPRRAAPTRQSRPASARRHRRKAGAQKTRAAGVQPGLVWPGDTAPRRN